MRKYSTCRYKIIVLIGVVFCSFVLVSDSHANVSIQPTPTNGLQAYWTADAKTINWGANTLADTTANGNTGTLVSMTSGSNQVAGKKGQALFFDGATNFVTLVTNPISVISSPNSVCTWTRTNDTSSFSGGWNESLLNFYTDSDNAVRMGSVVNTGNLFVSFRSGGTYYSAQTTNSVFSNNTWVHVCYVWNGAGLALYANGTSLSTTTNPDAIGLVNVIGARNDIGDGIWSGSIDDMRVYSRALTATEIRQIYQSGAFVLRSVPSGITTIATTPQNFLTSGLVGHWTFDGNKMNWATNRATDSSGQGNTGTLTNMSTTTSPAQGKIGQGLSFDGVDDRVSTALQLPSSGALATSFWMKGRPAGTISNIFTQDVGGEEISISYIPASNAFAYENTNNDTDNLGGWNYTLDDKWHHIVLVEGYSGDVDDASFYVDGVLLTSLFAGSPQTISTGNLTIGARPDSTNPYTGVVDDFRVYNRVLSATEVKQLYNQGR